MPMLEHTMKDKKLSEISEKLRMLAITELIPEIYQWWTAQRRMGHEKGKISWTKQQVRK